MTKEEIANIKRIDTSLNVFRKKARKISEALEELKKAMEPLQTEYQDCISEIDFWQKPVIERYGKTTEELLKESGEETSSEISAEEEKEEVSEPSSVEDSPASEENAEPESEPNSDTESESESESESNGLDLGDLPEEWE